MPFRATPKNFLDGLGLCLCLFAILAAFRPTPCQAQTIQWLHQFGTTANDFTYGMAVDATGIYVVAHTFSGTMPGQTSAGGVDVILRKYDTNGNELWTRQFGTSGSDEVRDVAADGTGAYVVGITNSVFPGVTPEGSNGGNDVFVRKYDNNGNVQWTRQFGTSVSTFASDIGTGAVADGTGIYVVGFCETLPGQPPSAAADVFVRKYDRDGNQVWTRQFGSSGNDQSREVAVDETGVSVVGIATNGTALPGHTSAGLNDAIVGKYSTSGNLLWTRQFGTANDDVAYGVAGHAGSVYVAGSVGFSGALPGQTSAGGTADAFVRKYDASGNELWTRQFGTAGNDQAFGVAADATGAYIAGMTDGALAGQATVGLLDIFVRKYDTDGNVLWTRTFGTAGGDKATAVALDASDMYVAGDSFGTFPGETRPGLSDTFVAKLTPSAPSGPVVFVGGVVNSASFALHPAPLAPGSIATIFGSNLTDGSSVLSSSFGSNGRLVTTLAGSQVRINGVLAPMFFATPGQLAVQIPMEVAGQTTATVDVTVGGQTSAPVNIFIDTVAPGIFTTNQQGTGAGAITHLNGSQITAANPARPSEIVVLYATGLGVLNPPLVTGAPSAGNATAVPSTVTVDGVAAPILFSGTTPGLVGLNQVNLQIPAGTRTASNIPVILRSGAKQSQTVTIAVAP